MAPKPYPRPVNMNRRLLVYPDRLEVQARHPLSLSWETVARFDPEQTYQATVFAREVQPWPKPSAETWLT